MEIQFTVTGDPRPKGRPRLGRYGNVFTPRATKEAEEEFLKQALKHRPSKPINGPIAISLKFFKKKIYTKTPHKIQSVFYADRRPDLDNYIKLVIDAMNEWFWIDDSQIVEITAGKYYEKEPRTEVYIKSLEA